MSNNTPDRYRPWRTDEKPILPPELSFFEAKVAALERRVAMLEARLEQREHADVPGPLPHPATRRHNEAA